MRPKEGYLGVGGLPVSYDGNFNLTGFNGAIFSYNAQNQLVSGSKGTNTVQFVYDGLGRNVKRTTNGASIIIAYDGWKPLVDYDSNGNLLAANIYGPGADEILTRWVSTLGTHLRYHHDVHGNVTWVLNDAGQPLERYTYDAFGKPKIMDWGGNQRTATAIQNRFMFQGREWIPELGIYDYRHRMYHPQLGRFLQMDPIGFDAGDMNLFRYCGDDPIDLTDPMGLQTSGASDLISPDRIWEMACKSDSGNASQLTLSEFWRQRDQPAGNDNARFYGDVRSFAGRREVKGIDPVAIGHALAANATEAAHLTDKDLRRDDKGYWGVERATAEYVDGNRLIKQGPDPGKAYRYSPHAFLPKPPNGLSPKALFLGSHSHGPQSGRSLEAGDRPSAEGQNRFHVSYISSVARSTDPMRVSIYVPFRGFYHTIDGGNSFFVGQ